MNEPSEIERFRQVLLNIRALLSAQSLEDLGHGGIRECIAFEIDQVLPEEDIL